MNILIVGNGFDLSHYLPTKYDHFMVAMDAIENWDELKGDMGFDDLFGFLYEKESYFFGYTKAMYKTGEIKISIDQIKELKIKLKENIWYQYFGDHVREVKTWIDFELKIQEALRVVFNFFEQLEQLQKTTDFFESVIKHNKNNADNCYIVLRKKESYILSILNILIGEFYIFKDFEDYPGVYVKKNIEVERNANWFESKYELNNKYISELKSYCEFNFSKVIFDLQQSLDDFLILFEWYLSLLECLVKHKNFKKLEIMSNSKLSKIYSFNYTKTPEKIYDFSNIDFLHGAVESSNMVLGVSNLDSQILEKYNFYGFVKYHQKLMKNTHYNFILEDKVVMDVIRNARGDFYKDGYDLNIIIWGHSLDRSDENYIREVFSFNEKIDEQIKVIIFYFNNSAYFDLLSNLILILGIEKVENWMKKGWLIFEKNPDIAEINDIKPIDLPKM